jgi:hypothetical protein
MDKELYVDPRDQELVDYEAYKDAEREYYVWLYGEEK